MGRPQPPPHLLLLAALQLLSTTTATEHQQQQDHHLAHYDDQASSSSFGEPVFRLEPPSVLNFASSQGATLLCLASGSPKPTISWYSSASGLPSSAVVDQALAPASSSFSSSGQQQLDQLQELRPVSNVTNLRQIIHNGAALRLLPFNESDLRHDVHSTEYRCVASNPLATIHSRACLVQAVVESPLELKVGDEFAALGSLAVFKCRPAPPAQQQGHLLHWATSDGLQVGAGETWPPQGNKLVAFRTGELHVNQVEMADLRRTYGCRWRNPVTGREASSSGLAQLILLTGDNSMAAPTKPQVAHTVSQVLASELDFISSTGDNSTLGAHLTLPCAIRPLSGRDEPRWLYLAPTGSGPQEAQPIQWPHRAGRSHLSLLRPRAAHSGRYLCRLGEETMCDINVIIRRPLQLAMELAELDDSRQDQQVDLPEEDLASEEPPAAANANSNWLGRAFDWLGPTATATNKDHHLFQHRRRHAHQTDQLPADPTRIRVSGPGVVRAPPIVEVGARLRLECRARGGPVEWVRWYRGGRSLQGGSSNGEHPGLQVELGERAWPTAASKSDNWRVVGRLEARQLQAGLAGLQQFECEAGNRAGERARAGLAVFVAGRRQLEWARRQCPLASEGSMEEEEEQLDAGELAFRRANPLRRALLLEGEPARLDCPLASPNASSPVEWRRFQAAQSECQGAQCPAAEGSQLNQLFAGALDSPLVINGTSLQIRSPLRRHDEAAYSCGRQPHHPSSSTGRQDDTAAAAAGQDQHRDQLAASRMCQQQQQPEEAGQQTSSISIRIVAKPKIEPFEFSRQLEEGMRAWLVCGLSAGQPPLDITWFKDGRLLVEDGETSLSSNQFASTLTFQRIRPAHSGLYTCVAANAFASANHSSRLVVNVAPYFIEPPRSKQAVLGGQLLVDCRAGGQPSPQIRWRKLVGPPALSSGRPTPSSGGNREEATATATDEQQVAPQTPQFKNAADNKLNEFRIVTSNSHIQVLENGSMFIRDVELGDASRYLCQASNGIQPSLSELVEVGVLQPARFEASYETVAVKRDSMVRFNCAPRGDQPMRLEWHKGPHPLVRSSLSLANRSLTEESASWKEASSAKYSELLHLANSTASTEHHTLTEVATGSGQAEAEQQPFQKLSVAATKSELLISYADRQDSGSFVCVARNAHGTDRLTYRLLVQEPPDPPQQLQALRVQASSLDLTWRAPFDGNLPLQHFVVEFRRLASSSLMPANHHASSGAGEWARLVVPVQSSQNLPEAPNVTSQHHQVGALLRQLRPRSAYQLRVAAVNAMGQGAFSAPLTIATAEEPPQQPPNDLRAQPVSSSQIKVMWRAPAQLEEAAPIRGYHIAHRRLLSPSDSQQVAASGQPPLWLATTSMPAQNHTGGAQQKPPEGNESYEFLLGQLDRNARYEIRVQPYNAAGLGPPSETLGQTLRFDKPGQPQLQLVATRRQSLELRWQVSGEQPLLGFSLFYKCEYDDWQEVQLAVIYTYVLDQLRCGNRYQLYLSAFNVVGRSDPSDVLAARTEGGPPVAPTDARHFLRPNTSEITLDMAQWQSGGCPIASFMVQYKRLQDRDWQDLSEARSALHNHLLALPDLEPATWYKLLVTAVNEAGNTNAEFLFATLDSQGRQPPAPAAASSTTSSLGAASSNQADSRLLQLLGLSGSQGGQKVQAPEHALLPLACLLLLLLTAAAAYLYYARALAASSSRHSHQSSSGSSAGSARLNPTTSCNRLTAAADEKQLIQAGGHCMSAAVRLMLNGGGPAHPLEVAAADSLAFPQPPPTSVNATNWPEAPPSSSLSTRSTNCQASSSSSAPSSQTGGAAKLATLHLIDESSLCLEPDCRLVAQEQQQQQYYQMDGSPAHHQAHYASACQQATADLQQQQQQAELHQWAASQAQAQGQPQQQQQRQLTSSASFASAADLIQRQAYLSQFQQEPVEPLYQRLESFAGKAHTLKLGGGHLLSQNHHQPQAHHHQTMTMMTMQGKAATLHRDSQLLQTFQPAAHYPLPAPHFLQHPQQQHFLSNSNDCDQQQQQQQHVLCLSNPSHPPANQLE